MKAGDLYVSKQYADKTADALTYVEIQRTFDKPDIDPYCPESVAIISMVDVIVLTGPNIGTKHRHRRQQFRRHFKKVETQVAAQNLGAPCK